MDEKTVLVVDDDPTIRSLLQAALEDEGYRVCVADNGAAALALAHHETADLIVLDLNMPVMDGREFHRRVQENGHAGTPVLILSAVGARRAQRELGTEAAIEKPFDLDDLLTTVADLVAR